MPHDETGEAPQYDQNGVLIPPGGDATSGTGDGSHTMGDGSGGYGAGSGEGGYGTGSGEGGGNSGAFGWGYNPSSGTGYGSPTGTNNNWVDLQSQLDTSSSVTKTIKSVSELHDILRDTKFEAVGNFADQGITEIDAKARWSLYYSPLDEDKDPTFNVLNSWSSVGVNGRWSATDGDTFTTNEAGESVAEIDISSSSLVKKISDFVSVNSDKDYPSNSSLYNSHFFDGNGDFARAEEGEICLTLSPTEFNYRESKSFDPNNPYASDEIRILNNPSLDPYRTSISIEEARTLTPDIKISFDSAFWKDLKDIALDSNPDSGGQIVGPEDLSANWADASLEATGISTDDQGVRVIDIGAIHNGAETLKDFKQSLETALAFDLNLDNVRRRGNASFTVDFTSQYGDDVTLSIGNHEKSWTTTPGWPTRETAVNSILTDGQWTGTSFEFELNDSSKTTWFLKNVGDAHKDLPTSNNTGEILWTLKDIEFRGDELWPRTGLNEEYDNMLDTSSLNFQFKTKLDSSLFDSDETFNEASGISQAEGVLDTSAAKGIDFDLLKTEDFLDKLSFNIDKGYAGSKLLGLNKSISSTISFDVYDEDNKLEGVELRLGYDREDGRFELQSTDFKNIKRKIYEYNPELRSNNTSIEDLNARDITLKLKEDDAVSIYMSQATWEPGAVFSEVRLSRDGNELTDLSEYTNYWTEEVTSTPDFDYWGYPVSGGWGYDRDWNWVEQTKTTYEQRSETYLEKTSTGEFEAFSDNGGSWAPEIYDNIGEIKLTNLWSAPEALQISSIQAKSLAISGEGGEWSGSTNGEAVKFGYNVFAKDVSTDYDPQAYIDPTKALKQIGVLGQDTDFQNDIYGKEYTLQITAQALGGFDLEGADITIGYDSRIFNDIQASDITIGAEMPIANAVLIDKGTNGEGTIRIAASSLSEMLTGGDGIPTTIADGVLATINLNFDETQIETLGRDSATGQLVANPLEFTISANSDETILSKSAVDSNGFVNKNIQSLRDLGDVEGSKVAVSGDAVTLFEAAVNLGQTSGIVMGTQRTIGSDAAFTNLVRSGDTIETVNEWKNVGNMTANNIIISGIKDSDNNQTNAYAELVEDATRSYFINDDATKLNNMVGGSFIDGEYIATAAESGKVHAAIKITGAAGNVVDLSDGIYQIKADGGAAQFNTGQGSKNLITFAGDLNYDGRVSMKDIAYLNAGAARQTSGTTETLVTDSDGVETTVSTVNEGARALDVDANFDGTISMLDLEAIDADWGKSLHDASESFTGKSSDFAWADLDQQFYDHDGDAGTDGLAAGEWDNKAFKDANTLEFAADSDYVAPLDVGAGAAADAVGGNGPTEVQGGLAATSTTDDISGDFFQNPSST